MPVFRTLLLAPIALLLLGGCGSSTPEVDNAELIQKEAPKPANSPVVPPPVEGASSKETPKD